MQQSIQHPVSRRQSVIAINLDPRTYVDYEGGEEIDLISELTNNHKLYYVEKKPGVEWVNLVDLPAKVKTTLEKLKAKVPFPREPGLATAICCCVSNGLPIIQTSEPVSSICSVRDYFYSLPQEGTPREEFIAQYLRSQVKVDLESSKRVNVAVPDELKKRLQGLAVNIGVTESSLAVLCIMTVLRYQDTVPPGYQSKWTETLAEFGGLLDMKRVGAEALVKAL